MGGIFDLFTNNRNTNNTDKELQHLKKKLSEQENWIKQLHEFSSDLHSHTKYIKKSNIEHKKELLSYISNLHDWVDYFNENHNSMKKDLNNLKRDITEQLKEDFKTYHSHLLGYVNHKLTEIQEDKQKLKEDLVTELRKEYFASIDNTEGEHNEEDIINVDNVMHYNYNVELTNPEKDLLRLLFNENKPLTYENMAIKLNKSVNTIRVYMNALKSKKDIIDEFKSVNGKKIFSIKNSEIVKTLFNVK